MAIRRLNTASEVIDALGGNKPFAQLVSTPKKPRRDQHVSNYRTIGLPPDTRDVVNAALAQIGCEAPGKLFKQVPVPNPGRLKQLLRAAS
jgi:hypothetical protein